MCAPEDFHFSAQPIWGQRFIVGVRSPARASSVFTNSCGFHILRDGSKTASHPVSRPQIISVRICAAAMEVVIPHFPNPVSTYHFLFFSCIKSDCREWHRVSCSPAPTIYLSSHNLSNILLPASPASCIALRSHFPRSGALLLQTM